PKGGGGGSQMPNPVDGTGEGPDKDWWRGLPNASVFDIIAKESAPGWKVDEGGESVAFSPGRFGGTSYLLSVLFPPPIRVEPGGEGLILDLSAMHSSGGSGTTTTDGWGDKPRSLAEALAAPRIRGGALSRF